MSEKNITYEDITYMYWRDLVKILDEHGLIIIH